MLRPPPVHPRLPSCLREYLMSDFGAAPASIKPAGLPIGWRDLTLVEVAEVVMGNSPPGTSYNDVGQGVPLVNGPAEFGKGPLSSPSTSRFTEEGTKFCEPGDLLVCVRGWTTGRTNVADQRYCIGRGVAAVRGYEAQQYLNHFVASRSAALLARATGSTFPSISISELANLRVPVPPLNQQPAIVTALERELSAIDKGVSFILAARDHSVQMTGAVLQSAFSGDAGLRLPELDVSPGQEVGRGQASNALADANGAGRKLRRLSEICELKLGKARSPSNRAGEHATPYIRAANITNEGLDLREVFEMDFSPREREQFELRAGDIVVAEASGSSDQVGKPALWSGGIEPCCFQNTVIRLRPIGALPEYVLILLRHCYTNGVFSRLSAGVGINHLGLTRLGEILVPVPDLDEQRRVVAMVDARLSSIAHARTVTDRALAQAGELRQAVWQRAFSGRLCKLPEAVGSAAEIADGIAERRAGAAKRPSRRATKELPLKLSESPGAASVLEALARHPQGISPEGLLSESGYSAEQVEDFYEALASIGERLLEERPSGEDAMRWPRDAAIVLKLAS